MKTKSPLIVMAAIACLAVFTGSDAQSQSIYWTGSAGTNWNSTSWSSTSANPGVPTTPVNGNTLEFRNSLTGGNPTNRTNNNDLVGLSVAGINMFNGNPSYTLNGNQLTTTGNINGGGSGNNTINLNLVLNNASAAQFTGAGSGGMFTINGTISETAGSKGFTHQGGSITLNGANSFSGTAILGNATGTNSIFINTLANASTAQSLGTGLVQVGNTVAGSLAQIIYTGAGPATTDKQWRVGSSTAANSLMGAIRNNGGGAITWNGTQVLGNASSSNTKTFILGGTNNDANTWNSAIQNGGANTQYAVTKENAGKWILAGTNTYTGATTVTEGTLLINGSTAAGSAVSVASGAVFGGNGTVNGNLTLANGAFFAFDTAYTLDLGGSLTLNSSFGVASLRDLNGGAINWGNIANGTYTLMNTSFTFNASNISNFGEANAFVIGGGRTAYFDNGSLALTVIPEPSTLALLAVSLTSLAIFRRRRRRQSN